MSTIALSFLPLLWPVLGTVAVSLLGAAVLALRKHLAANAKTLPLSDVADVAGQALDAAIKAAGAAGPTPAAIKAAEQAVFNILAAHRPELVADGEAELRALCSHAVALKAGAPISLPGGLVANAPAPTQGLVLLPLLALLASVTLPDVGLLVCAAAAVLALAFGALWLLSRARSNRWPRPRPPLGSLDGRRSERGFVPVVVLVIVGIVVLLGGGTTALVLSEHKGPVVLDCTEAKLSAGAASIEGQVATTLAGGGDWEGALLALGARVGSDVVACAVTAILTPLDGGAHAALAPQVRANGEAWLTSHGFAVPR